MNSIRIINKLFVNKYFTGGKKKNKNVVNKKKSIDKLKKTEKKKIQIETKEYECRENIFEEKKKKRTFFFIFDLIIYGIFLIIEKTAFLLVLFSKINPFNLNKNKIENENKNKSNKKFMALKIFFNDKKKNEFKNLEDDSKKDLDSERLIELNENKIFYKSFPPLFSTSKYLVIPPQRLFPLKRNSNKLKKKKTLILDLDETLIHLLSKGTSKSLYYSLSSASKVIEIKLNSIATLYYVHKRPYCNYFLSESSKYFDLQIFTASVKEYADPIIDWLENEIYERKISTLSRINMNQLSHDIKFEKLFSKRYYRNDCTFKAGVGYIKNISKFFSKDDLKNVVILDNSPVSFSMNKNNAIMIEGWINDQNDKGLLNLLPMLRGLSFCIDVRYILGLKKGEIFFEI